MPLSVEENKLEDLSGVSLLEISSTSTWHISTRNEVRASAWAPLGSDPTRRICSDLAWALSPFHCWWTDRHCFLTHRPACALDCWTKLSCGNGTSRQPQILSLSLCFFTDPYLVLVAASSVAPAAVGAFVLAFSSEKSTRIEQSHSSKCNNFVSLQISLQTCYQLTHAIYTYAHTVLGSVSILSLNVSVSSSDLHAKFTPNPGLLWAYEFNVCVWKLPF